MSRPEPAPFFVFRTPFFPLSTFIDWGNQTENEQHISNNITIGNDLIQARAVLRDRLSKWMSSQVVREAILLASPDLASVMASWPIHFDSEKGRRLERTLVRYFTRMCTRPTPFGLFAGCSIGKIGKDTQLLLDSEDSYSRCVRLDMEYLGRLAMDLENNKNVRKKLMFRPNSSLYNLYGSIRYMELDKHSGIKNYHLISVKETQYLTDTLARSSQGATLEALAEALVDENILMPDAIDFIHSLIDNQILVSDLGPVITGPDPMQHMISRIQFSESATHILRSLEKIQTARNTIEGSRIGSSLISYQIISDELNKLFPQNGSKNPLLADLIKPSLNATISDKVINDVCNGISILHSLFGQKRNSPLDKFIESFYSRYESQEVPLMEALDAENGIGFSLPQSTNIDSALPLDGFVFNEPKEETKFLWTAFHNYLLIKLIESEKKGRNVISLAYEELLPFFNSDPFPLPISFAALFELGRKDDDIIIFLAGLTGASGAKLLGRFCHASPDIKKIVSDFLQQEENVNPEAIHAEIVHLHNDRVGNVILRPLLRQFEIPFFGQSGAPIDRQIPLSDLLVSVRNGKIILRSSHLGKEVIPHLTTAHDFSFQTISHYHFLCLLQEQGTISGLEWSWGALSKASFLPRVEVGRLIFTKARWNVTSVEFRPICEAKEIERWQRLLKWREERRIPRLVNVIDENTKLVVDFQNILSVDSFIELVKNRDYFAIEELFPEPEMLPVESPEGHFIHEVILPFTYQNTKNNVISTPKTTKLRRIFHPGSEWLYIKIYAGPNELEHLLRHRLGPVVRNLIELGAADSWFFIRYADPDWHLRLRIHGDPEKLWVEGMSLIQKSWGDLFHRTKIWKLQIDTYQRELERYGDGEAMLLSERIFQADSEAVLCLLESHQNAWDTTSRWWMCLFGMDSLLNDFGFDIIQKRDLLTNLSMNFKNEFNLDNKSLSKLGHNFRKHRAGLSSLLNGHPPQALQEGIDIFQRRSSSLKNIVKELKNQHIISADPAALLPLVGSYLHMHANRILRTEARTEELVLYDLLLRHYSSEIARN